MLSGSKGMLAPSFVRCRPIDHKGRSMKSQRENGLHYCAVPIRALKRHQGYPVVEIAEPRQGQRLWFLDLIAMTDVRLWFGGQQIRRVCGVVYIQAPDA